MKKIGDRTWSKRKNVERDGEGGGREKGKDGKRARRTFKKRATKENRESDVTNETNDKECSLLLLRQ